MDIKSRAIAAVGAKQVELREVTLPPIGEWDIQVEVEVSAISAGTESYYIANNEAYPFIPGYLSAGRVVEAGSEAARLFQEGDRITYFVSTMPAGYANNWMCGHISPAVLNVNPAKRNLMGRGTYVVKVPDGLSAEQAALSGLAGVSCLGADLALPKAGDRTLVVGQGLIGYFAAQHFKLRGATVAVADLYEQRLKLAAEAGIDYTIHSATSDMVQQVKSIWPQGADIIVDTTSNYKVIEQSFRALRPDGKVVFQNMCFGPGLDMRKFNAHRVQTVYFPNGVEGSGVAHSLSLMKSEALKTDHLITHRFPVERQARRMRCYTPLPIATWRSSCNGEFVDGSLWADYDRRIGW